MLNKIKHEPSTEGGVHRHGPGPPIQPAPTAQSRLSSAQPAEGRPPIQNTTRTRTHVSHAETLVVGRRAGRCGGAAAGASGGNVRRSPSAPSPSTRPGDLYRHTATVVSVKFTITRAPTRLRTKGSNGNAIMKGAISRLSNDSNSYALSPLKMNAGRPAR